MKLSVIIPVYNVENYLKRCLDSVINQTYKDLEIIVVNDGSTDSSLEIAREYAEEDKRIKIVNKENGGLSSSRNAGLDVATGEVVAFLDSDDWVELNAYELAMEAFNDHSADMVWFAMKNVYDEDETLNTQNFQTKIYCGDEVLAVFLGTNKKGPSLSSCNKLYASKVLKNIRFIEGKTSEDIYFNFQAFSIIKKIVRYDAELYHYFQRNGSISCGKIKKHSFDCIEMWNKVIQDLESKEQIKIVKFNKIHNIFTILLRATTFGVDESFVEFEEYKKAYLKVFRKNIFSLLNSGRLDFKRKLAVILLYLNYNLCGLIARKKLKVQ